MPEKKISIITFFFNSVEITIVFDSNKNRGNNTYLYGNEMIWRHVDADEKTWALSGVDIFDLKQTTLRMSVNITPRWPFG